MHIIDNAFNDNKQGKGRNLSQRECNCPPLKQTQMALRLGLILCPDARHRHIKTISFKLWTITVYSEKLGKLKDLLMNKRDF